MEKKILRDSDKTSREKGEKTNKQCKKVSKKPKEKGTLKKYIRKRKEEEADKHTTV